MSEKSVQPPSSAGDDAWTDFSLIEWDWIDVEWHGMRLNESYSHSEGSEKSVQLPSSAEDDAWTDFTLIEWDWMSVEWDWLSVNEFRMKLNESHCSHPIMDPMTAKWDFVSGMTPNDAKMSGMKGISGRKADGLNFRNHPISTNQRPRFLALDQ